MIILLDQYTVNGIYGDYFNSDKPTLHDDARMVVLELGGLESRPSLLIAVMFSLIIYIENRMYQSPRGLKKLNVIDEGWKLLDFKNEKVGQFIEKGYRTARRHTGAYITITQNIVDFDSPTASSAARAASYKAILKQSAKEFAKYNQLYPDQFSKLEKDMINGFGSAKEQWFSSLCCRWKRTAPGTACSLTRSAGRCTPPKARILSTCKRAGRRGRYPRCGIRTGVPQL